MRPYVSIDIETTGIDDRSEILQIAAVLDDGISPTGDLPKMNSVIKHEILDYCEPYALGMNAKLLEKVMQNKVETVTPKEAINELLTLLEKAVEYSGVDEKGKPKKVILSGKNLATFDLPKLRIFIQKHGGYTELKSFDKLIHYKTLDVGSLYWDTFGDNVSLSKINELTGRAAVSHDALDDALDVVYAVRYKMNKGQN